MFFLSFVVSHLLFQSNKVNCYHNVLNKLFRIRSSDQIKIKTKTRIWFLLNQSVSRYQKYTVGGRHGTLRTAVIVLRLVKTVCWYDQRRQLCLLPCNVVYISCLVYQLSVGLLGQTAGTLVKRSKKTSTKSINLNFRIFIR